MELERGLRGRACAGFTFVEILVAMAIGAAVLAAGVMAYSSIVVNGPRRTVPANVEIGSTTFNSYYGATNSIVAVSQAPDYSASAMAVNMREWFATDVASAVAVFSLGRNGLSGSSMRPTNIAIATNSDARSLTSPDAFRVLLDPGATVFSAYVGAMTATNSSTYILGRSTNAGSATVRAIYETDLLTTTSPPGVYASVRRYEGTSLTAYYHVFYAGDTNLFRPLAVFFDRDVFATGVAANDTYKKAANRPFYFIWWPDPTAKTLADNVPVESFSSLYAPRAGYYQMGGKTSLFFVVPAFPDL